MLMMDKGDVEGAIAATKGKLADPHKKEECIADIQKMVDIKQSHMWRSDMGSCVGSLCNISSLIDMEIGILEGAIEAIKSGDNNQATTLLDEYVAFVNVHYDNERSPY
jgi:hypothetical protein